MGTHQAKPRIINAWVVSTLFILVSLLNVPGQTLAPSAPAPAAPDAASPSAKQLIQALEDKLYAEDKQKAASGDYNRNANQLSQLAQLAAQIDSGRYSMVLQSWDQITRQLDSRYYADTKAIEAQLLVEEGLQEKEALKQVEETLGQMKEPILAAKTDADLDDLWLKLTHQLRDMNQRGFGFNNSYNNDNGPINRLNGALVFVTTWQSYLANKNAGYNDAATAALQRLNGPAFGNSSFPILPKEEIEKRIAELATNKGTTNPEDPYSAVDALIDGMHTGDDASTVLLQLATIPRTAPDAFSGQVGLLETELKSLVSCTVDAKEGRYGNILGATTVPPKNPSRWYPKLSKYFTQTLTDVLPSFVDWKEMPPRKDGEKPDDYILRAALAARDQQKWWTELSLLEVWRNYALHNGTPTWLLGDLYSLQDMLNAQNLEAAGQIEPAIVYYLGAVTFSSKYGPAKEAGEKIKAFQQSQPEAYAAAVKEAQSYFVVPPANLGLVPDADTSHANKDH
jgi:hypothetical protein